MTPHITLKPEMRDEAPLRYLSCDRTRQWYKQFEQSYTIRTIEESQWLLLITDRLIDWRSAWADVDNNYYLNPIASVVGGWFWLDDESLTRRISISVSAWEAKFSSSFPRTVLANVPVSALFAKFSNRGLQDTPVARLYPSSIRGPIYARRSLVRKFPEEKKPRFHRFATSRWSEESGRRISHVALIRLIFGRRTSSGSELSLFIHEIQGLLLVSSPRERDSIWNF